MGLQPEDAGLEPYREHLRGFFGADGDDTDDPFIAAVNALNDPGRTSSHCRATG